MKTRVFKFLFTFIMVLFVVFGQNSFADSKTDIPNVNYEDIKTGERDSQTQDTDSQSKDAKNGNVIENQENKPIQTDVPKDNAVKSNKKVQTNKDAGDDKSVEKNNIQDTTLQTTTQENIDVEEHKLETINNYFIGVFRLYDKYNNKTYDFKASKAFTYDYKKEIPTLKVDEWSFKVFTTEIEKYFSDKEGRQVLYPVKIKDTNKYKITKIKVGQKKIDREKFKQELSRRIKENDYSIMEVPFVEAVNNEEQAKKNEVVLLSSYTTKYDFYNYNRSFNVMEAGKELDGIMLKPKQKFSYNNTVAKISPQLRVAKVIVNNEFVDGKGGGLCQVSTTLFNTVLEAGLKIDYRNNHSVAINYVPRGRDAMVSNWGDFIFTNNFANNIYLTYEKPSNGAIKLSVYGNKADKKNVKLWVTGGNRSFTLHRQIGKDIDRFYSRYSEAVKR